jgi:putative flippase GtrA/phosphoserine phosphatase
MRFLYYLLEQGCPMNVYDFDRTIYNGDSSVDFYIFVLCKKPYLIVLLPFQALGMAQYLFGIYSKENMKENFFIFTRFIPVQEMVLRFWDKNRKKIKSWYMRQKQDADVIISASPEFLLEPLVCGYLGVTLIASRIDENTGKYIGKNCFGEEKVIRLHEAYPDSVIDNFYSDSLSDSPLAKKAMQSFIVKGQKTIFWNDYKPDFIEKIKRTYFTREFILFVFCGGMGTLVNFISSLIISIALNPSVSYVLGYGISLFVAYSLNAKLIFHHKISRIGFIKFIISYIPNFLMLFGFVLVFLNLMHWNKVIVYALAGLLGLPVTFLLVKIMVFSKERR